ncbi:30S ribosomal protein S2 [Patescibacteria group bacterium]|nr:30S ribosomal protein S2 [Patescibacteria group bacterium]
MAVVTKPTEQKLDPITQEMMAAGLHFGHKTSKTHPKMRPFITGVRNTVHIIDLEKTKEKLKEVTEYVKKLKEEGKILLLVGTKVQQRSLIQETAKACGLPFVTQRWIGGTFTNFGIISKRIERLKELEEQQASGEWDEKYTKKEQLDLKEEIRTLETRFGGIKELTKVPDAIFICDLKENVSAVREAKKKSIPIIAISDTDTNPEEADYFVPANNDAVSSLKYILDKIQEAWIK